MATRGLIEAGGTPAPSLSTSSELTSFVGRGRELRALSDLSQQDAGLISLLGPGGMGKTRLAREFLRHRDCRHRRVVEIDLTAVDGADGLLAAVSLSLGAPRATSDDIVAVLAAGGPSLLLLDNFDHVTDHAAVLAPWLAAAPIRIVVTSRRRLGLPGEHVIDIGPLSHSDAVALFAARARELGCGAGLADHADEISDIANRVERIPLAIELAAAQLRVLSVPELRQRLTAQLDILAARGIGHADRHATLRATLDSSWQLLSPWASDALAQCSVFCGGFSVEAAEAVINVDHHAGAPSVLDVIHELADHSMLTRARQDGGRTHLGLYECVRDYAAEQLAGMDEARRARTRHTVYFLGRAESAAARLLGPEAASAMAQLRCDFANIVAVHEREIRTDASASVRAAIALYRYIAATGLYPAYHDMFDAAVSTAERGGQADLEAQARVARAWFLAGQTRFSEAIDDLARAGQLAGAVGALHTAARCEQGLALIDAQQGRYDSAYAHARRATEMFEELEHTDYLAASLNAVAHFSSRAAASRTLSPHVIGRARRRPAASSVSSTTIGPGSTTSGASLGVPGMPTRVHSRSSAVRYRRIKPTYSSACRYWPSSRGASRPRSRRRPWRSRTSRLRGRPRGTVAACGSWPSQKPQPGKPSGLARCFAPASDSCVPITRWCHPDEMCSLRFWRPSPSGDRAIRRPQHPSRRRAVEPRRSRRCRARPRRVTTSAWPCGSCAGSPRRPAATKTGWRSGPIIGGFAYAGGRAYRSNPVHFCSVWSERSHASETNRRGFLSASTH